MKKTPSSAPRERVQEHPDLCVRGYAKTVPAIGEKESENLDAVFLSEEDGVAAVCDGVSSIRESKKATELVVNLLRFPALRNLLNMATQPQVEEAMQTLFEILARAVFIRSKSPDIKNGIFTTCVMAKVWRDLRGDFFVTVVHAGDSRAYLKRGSKLRCLTVDHTEGIDLLRKLPYGEKRILGWQRRINQTASATELKEFLEKIGLKNMKIWEFLKMMNSPTKLLGLIPGNDTNPDIKTFPLHVGDEIYLFTDGVCGNTMPDEAENILTTNLPLEDRVERFIQVAQRNSAREIFQFHPDDMGISVLTLSAIIPQA